MSQPTRRVGVTLIELLMVITVFGLFTAALLPKFGTVRVKNRISAARGQIANQVTAARMSAIQRGQPVVFHLSGSNGSMWTTAEVNGVSTAVGGTRMLGDVYGVTLTTSADSIRFDPRGMTRPQLTSIAIVVVSASGIRDSVCVSTLGIVLGSSCAL